MAPKRCTDSESVCHSPVKRRRISSVPNTPQTPSYATPGPSTPRTPYPPRPSDSPTNPFGRKRTLTLTHSLPPPTQFSKHLPLRFQFVRRGLPNTYHRVVQVPLSYTFTHLRCLIAFLFGGGFSWGEEHLFEIKKDIKMYSAGYKPGQIKTGKTWAKLSSARDPCRYRPEGDEDDEGAPEDDEGLTGEVEEVVEEEEEEWEWEAEEEFTLAHAWPWGGDLERGIVYHHNSKTQVHIAIHVGVLARRQGRSNTPHVFFAQGRIQLAPRQRLEDEAESDSDNDDTPYLELGTEKWNVPDAFATYLSRVMGKVPRAHNVDDDDDDDDDAHVFGDYHRNVPRAHYSSTPELLLSSSSPLSNTTAPSSPPPFAFPLAIPFPTSYPKYTPAPPRAHRLLSARVQRRMEKGKTTGFIAEANDDDSDNAEEGEEEDTGPGTPFVRPVLNEGEVWDPFGDEDEV